MNRSFATLIPSSRPLPAPRSSSTIPVKAIHPGERKALCDDSKGGGEHTVRPYRDVLGPPAGRCIEEDPFAVIDGLEKLEEEEREG